MIPSGTGPRGTGLAARDRLEVGRNLNAIAAVAEHADISWAKLIVHDPDVLDRIPLERLVRLNNAAIAFEQAAASALGSVSHQRGAAVGDWGHLSRCTYDEQLASVAAASRPEIEARPRHLAVVR